MPTISEPDAVSMEYINTAVCEDGYHLRYRVWRACSSAAGTIVLVNGMMSHSVWFRELAYPLTKLQFEVVGADRRGSGLNDPGRGDMPSRQILLSDLHKIIECEGHTASIYLLGWCWGALPVVNLALELGQRLSGLVLLAPGLFPSEQIKRTAEECLNASQGGDPHSPVVHSPLTAEMFSDHTDVRDFILNDDRAQRMFTPRFFRITGEMSLIARARLRQLTQPILLLLATHDKTVNQEQTLKAFQQLPRTQVSTAMLACHHGMQFEMPEEIGVHISQWVQRRSGVAFRPV